MRQVEPLPECACATLAAELRSGNTDCHSPIVHYHVAAVWQVRRPGQVATHLLARHEPFWRDRACAQRRSGHAGGIAGETHVSR